MPSPWRTMDDEKETPSGSLSATGTHTHSGAVPGLAAGGVVSTSAMPMMGVVSGKVSTLPLKKVASAEDILKELKELKELVETSKKDATSDAQARIDKLERVNEALREQLLSEKEITKQLIREDIELREDNKSLRQRAHRSADIEFVVTKSEPAKNLVTFSGSDGSTRRVYEPYRIKTKLRVGHSIDERKYRNLRDDF